MALLGLLAGLAAPVAIDLFRKWLSGSDKKTQEKALEGAPTPIRDFFFGTGTTTEQVQKHPEALQNKANEWLMNQFENNRVPEFSEFVQQAHEGFGGLPGAEQEEQAFDFGPIADEARRGFREDTIPSIAERFAGLGASRGSAFQRQSAAAGANLEKSLAALKSQMGPQLAMQRGQLRNQRTQLAMQRAGLAGRQGMGMLPSILQQTAPDTVVKPGQPGLFQRIAGGIGTGVGMAGAMFAGNKLKSLFN
ncbi:hypothetical protein IID22_03840 [Patescibacteria group bacterium]|nr:hypothetical protein [Patescibacteria group bacterium]